MNTLEREPFSKLKLDRYFCVLVDSARVNYKTPLEFEKNLEEYLEIWKKDGARAIWIKIYIEHTAVVSGCVRLGFVFHHTKPHYLMMKKWISSETDSLPEYATQYLGCGGFVVNTNHQVLVVQERFADNPHWKFPGGLAMAGEDIGVAACREVKEETGIETEFISVLTFRHMHNFKFGCSDLYFVCLLRPLTDQITVCHEELAHAQWMDVDEYIQRPDIVELNRHVAVTYRDHYLKSGTAIFADLMPLGNYGNRLVYTAQTGTPPSDDSVNCNEHSKNSHESGSAACCDEIATQSPKPIINHQL